MNQSDNINELAAALSKFQSVVPTLPKPASGYGYKYTPLDTVVEAIKNFMADFDLSYVQMPSTLDDGRPALTTQLMHSSGQWLRATMPLENITQKSMNDAQAQGAVITYARRYALTSMLGLVADEDTDAATVSRPAPKKQAKQKTQVRADGVNEPALARPQSRTVAQLMTPRVQELYSAPQHVLNALKQHPRVAKSDKELTLSTPLKDDTFNAWEQWLVDRKQDAEPQPLFDTEQPKAVVYG